MAEYLKLEFMKVVNYLLAYTHTHKVSDWVFKLQETGFAHMRICDGVGSYLQLCGLLAKLSLVRETAKAVWAGPECNWDAIIFNFSNVLLM